MVLQSRSWNSNRSPSWIWRSDPTVTGMTSKPGCAEGLIIASVFGRMIWSKTRSVGLIGAVILSLRIRDYAIRNSCYDESRCA